MTETLLVNPQEITEANEAYLHKNPDGTILELARYVEVGDNVYIDPSARIIGRCVLHNDVTILEEAVVVGPFVSSDNDEKEPTVIKEGTEVGPHAQIRESAIVGERVKVGNHAWICKKSFIQDGAQIDDNSIVPRMNMTS
jgi:NDP-sugar pyrophosphorylase family protein